MQSKHEHFVQRRASVHTTFQVNYSYFSHYRKIEEKEENLEIEGLSIIPARTSKIHLLDVILLPNHHLLPVFLKESSFTQ